MRSVRVAGAAEHSLSGAMQHDAGTDQRQLRQLFEISRRDRQRGRDERADGLRLAQPGTNDGLRPLVLRLVGPPFESVPEQRPRRVVGPFEADQGAPRLASAPAVAHANIATRSLGERGAKLRSDGLQRIAAAKVAPRETGDALRISDLAKARGRDEEAQQRMVELALTGLPLPRLPVE